MLVIGGQGLPIVRRARSGYKVAVSGHGRLRVEYNGLDAAFVGDVITHGDVLPGRYQYGLVEHGGVPALLE